MIFIHSPQIILGVFVVGDCHINIRTLVVVVPQACLGIPALLTSAEHAGADCIQVILAAVKCRRVLLILEFQYKASYECTLYLQLFKQVRCLRLLECLWVIIYLDRLQTTLKDKSQFLSRILIVVCQRNNFLNQFSFYCT